MKKQQLILRSESEINVPSSLTLSANIDVETEPYEGGQILTVVENLIEAIKQIALGQEQARRVLAVIANAELLPETLSTSTRAYITALAFDSLVELGECAERHVRGLSQASEW